MDFSEQRHEAHLRPRQQHQHQQQQQQQQQHQQIPHIKVSLDQFDDRAVGADAVLVDKRQFSDVVVVVIVVDVDDILRRQEGELRQLPQNRQDGFSAKDNSDHLVSVGRMVRPKLK